MPFDEHLLVLIIPHFSIIVKHFRHVVAEWVVVIDKSGVLWYTEKAECYRQKTRKDSLFGGTKNEFSKTKKRPPYQTPRAWN